MEEYIRKLESNYPWHYDIGIPYQAHSNPTIEDRRSSLQNSINSLVAEYDNYLHKEEASNQIHEDLREVSRLEAQIFDIQVRRKLSESECFKLTYKEFIELLVAKIQYIEDKENDDYIERKMVLDSISDMVEAIRASVHPKIFIRVIAHLPRQKQKYIKDLYHYLIDQEITKRLISIQHNVPQFQITERTMNTIVFLMGVFSLLNLIITITNSKNGGEIGIIIASLLFILWIIFWISIMYYLKSKLKNRMLPNEDEDEEEVGEENSVIELKERHY